jgi:hypothetical protein
MEWNESIQIKSIREVNLEWDLKNEHYHDTYQLVCGQSKTSKLQSKGGSRFQKYITISK